MAKEMVISAAPHETRVAILEDGQLFEIYVERQKEFALVGSIYKGKVTRVLPGMQSAFVEIGLDTDAFLYVSDFLEDLEEYDQIVHTVEDKVQRMEEQGGEALSSVEVAQGAAFEPSDDSFGRAGNGIGHTAFAAAHDCFLIGKSIFAPAELHRFAPMNATGDLAAGDVRDVTAVAEAAGTVNCHPQNLPASMYRTTLPRRRRPAHPWKITSPSSCPANLWPNIVTRHMRGRLPKRHPRHSQPRRKTSLRMRPLLLDSPQYHQVPKTFQQRTFSSHLLTSRPRISRPQMLRRLTKNSTGHPATHPGNHPARRACCLPEHMERRRIGSGGTTLA